MMPAQSYGVAKGGDEYFTVRTGAEMPSKLGADVLRQLVVNIGGQLSENVEASAFTRRVMMRTLDAPPHGFFSGHEPLSLGRQSFCD